jgi:hypothetical protein
VNKICIISTACDSFPFRIANHSSESLLWSSSSLLPLFVVRNNNLDNKNKILNMSSFTSAFTEETDSLGLLCMSQSGFSYWSSDIATAHNILLSVLADTNLSVG